MCSLFHLPSNECWVVFVPSPNALLLTYRTIGLIFVNGAPHAHIAKTKKQPITRVGGHTFKGHIALPHV
jgi:hypothetical protein